jgi:DNA-binding transcriptional LysR family regulator
MGDLDLRRLRYFLALAGTLNYGRAAEELHIAQPALSRSVAALERELGVKLFDRSKAGTRLTRVGELLKEEADRLLHEAESLQRRIRLADREGRGVTIGFMPGLTLTPLVRHLEREFPGLCVDVVRTSWGEQIAGLRDGRFDACLASRPFEEEGLTVVDLFTEYRAVAMPGDHRLAGKAEVTLQDLAEDRLLQPVEAVPGWSGLVSSFGPFDEPPTVEEKFEHVAAGRGVLIISESATRYYRRPDLTFARVNDLAETQVCLAIETRRDSAVLRELLAAAPGKLTGGNAEPA